MSDDFAPYAYWHSEPGFRGEPKQWVEVVPLTFGRARISVTDGFGNYDGW